MTVCQIVCLLSIALILLFNSHIWLFSFSSCVVPLFLFCLPFFASAHVPFIVLGFCRGQSCMAADSSCRVMCARCRGDVAEGRCL